MDGIVIEGLVLRRQLKFSRLDYRRPSQCTSDPKSSSLERMIMGWSFLALIWDRFHWFRRGCKHLAIACVEVRWHHDPKHNTQKKMNGSYFSNIPTFQQIWISTYGNIWVVYLSTFFVISQRLPFFKLRHASTWCQRRIHHPKLFFSTAFAQLLHSLRNFTTYKEQL